MTVPVGIAFVDNNSGFMFENATTPPVRDFNLWTGEYKSGRKVFKPYPYKLIDPIDICLDNNVFIEDTLVKEYYNTIKYAVLVSSWDFCWWRFENNYLDHLGVIDFNTGLHLVSGHELIRSYMPSGVYPIFAYSTSHKPDVSIYDIITTKLNYNVFRKNFPELAEFDVNLKILHENSLKWEHMGVDRGDIA